MTLFRYHNSDTVYEAVKKAESVLNLDDLKNRINFRFGDGVVAVEPYGYDNRVKWNTYIVTHNGHAVGYTNGALQ